MDQKTLHISDLTACQCCDLLLRKVALHHGQSSRCPRCHCLLRKGKRNSINKSLALSITGLLLFLPAILMPLFTFRLFGLHTEANVLQSITTLHTSGFYFVAVMVAFTTVLFPLLRMGLLFVISFSLKKRVYFSQLPRLFRIYIHFEEWGMLDVYLIGIMVALIKMYSLMDVQYQLGFFTFFTLVFILMATQVVLDRAFFWQCIEEFAPAGTKSGQSNAKIPLKGTALEAGLFLCHDCGKLVRTSHLPRQSYLRCPRCHAALHARKPNSIVRTWAFIVAAAILLLPANILPIMEVEFLGMPKVSTILDGVIHFLKDGSYGIGIIILTASVLVPVFKIVGLSIILLSIRFHRQRWLRQKTKMFRFISFIGRWSMLDIFVIALLGALVQFGFFSTTEAAPAATWFTIVVICSMLAAISFDPRELWDACCPAQTQQGPRKDERTNS